MREAGGCTCVNRALSPRGTELHSCKTDAHHCHRRLWKWENSDHTCRYQTNYHLILKCQTLPMSTCLLKSRSKSCGVIGERSTWCEAGFTVAREILMIKCLLRNIRHRNTCSFNSGNCITQFLRSQNVLWNSALKKRNSSQFQISSTKGLDLSQRFVID